MIKGLPIFKMATKSIKGWFPTTKSYRNYHIPFVSTIEEKFLYYVEFKADVLNIERADIDQSFADTYKLYRSELAPIVIPYEFEGKQRHYYPDYILTLKNGRTILVEVGEENDKKSKISLAKALATFEFCKVKGWEYWLVIDENIMSKTCYENFILLKSYDKAMYMNQEIMKSIVSSLESIQGLISVQEIVNIFITQYSQYEIEMATYGVITQLVKEGRIEFDFETKKLRRESRFRVIDKNEHTYILKDIYIPEDTLIEMYNASYIEINIQEQPQNRTTYIDTDYMSFEDKELFLKRRAAVLETISLDRKLSVSDISKKYNISRSNLYNLKNKYLQFGEVALIPYWKYDGQKTYIKEEIQDIIRQIYCKHPNWTAMKVLECDDLKKEIIKLSKEKRTLYHIPSYNQLYRFLSKLKSDKDLVPHKKNRENAKEKMTTLGA